MFGSGISVRLSAFILVYAIFMVTQISFMFRLYENWQARASDRANGGNGRAVSPYLEPDSEEEPDNLDSMFNRYWTKLSKIYSTAAEEVLNGGERRYATSMRNRMHAIARAAAGKGGASKSGAVSYGGSGAVSEGVRKTRERIAANTAKADSTLMRIEAEGDPQPEHMSIES